jgi:ubiquinone/menaquinone biosynthesis C-methylase UbiE
MKELMAKEQNQMASTAEDREQVESDFYLNSPAERPDSYSLGNLLNKMTDADVFHDTVLMYDSWFRTCTRVIEIGGGQGWASCLLKKLYPSIYITATDISPYAVQSLPMWEAIYRVKLNNSYACPAHKIPENDSSCDCVFTFASAHHFPRPAETLKEIFRVLKPGGKCLYLHEPASNRLFYPMVYRRVNRIRPVVKEDVLVPSHLEKYARECGLSCEINFHPTIKKRGRFETYYYLILGCLPVLTRILPCTANVIFSKPR